MALFMKSNIHLLPAGHLSGMAAVPVLSLALFIGASVYPAGSGHVVYAGDEAQTEQTVSVNDQEATEAKETPEQPETDMGFEDAVDYGDGDTGLSISFNDLNLSDDMKNELNSMSREDLLGYIKMIEAVIMNPDFNSLMQYQEVRDLIVTLAGNALDFAEEDPDLTEQILETMGVDRRAVLVFYTLLDARKNNPENVEQIKDFLTNEKSKEIFENVMGMLDEETVAQLADDFNEKLLELDLPEFGTQQTVTAQTETE